MNPDILIDILTPKFTAQAIKKVAEPRAEVGAIHPKAMPVILTTPDEVETGMRASAPEALKLQRPLPDGTLKIVARGRKKDGGPTD